MIRVSFEEMFNEFLRVLLKKGFSVERARLSARLFAEASRDGVYSHGLNRFPVFIDMIDKGYVDVDAEPVRLDTFGVVERWDGRLGPGNLNAYFCMKRAIELARENGMGCVALRNTNHWMRGGSYGWQAADAGCIGMCWTNTLPNMPPWGSVEARIGNNPIIMAIPRPDGNIVLDMAMSQYSNGQLQSHMLRKDTLEVFGGYDNSGELTTDPEAIMDTKRHLPIGYWKGSGLSILFDMIGMILSGGNSTFEIGKLGVETSVSQVFIAFDMSKLPEQSSIYQSIEDTINFIHTSAPVDEKTKVRYPGEGTILKRTENLSRGIPVDEGIWKKVLSL